MTANKTIINLLAAANNVLTTTIIPNLPLIDRRNSELIQRALEIAIRDLTIKSKHTAVSKRQKTHERHKNESVAIPNNDYTVSLRNDIRLGKFDNDLLGPITDLLELEIVKRLNISNPTYLPKAKYSYPVGE
jgi:hypothetical protein